MINQIERLTAERDSSRHYSREVGKIAILDLEISIISGLLLRNNSFNGPLWARIIEAGLLTAGAAAALINAKDSIESAFHADIIDSTIIIYDLQHQEIEQVNQSESALHPPELSQ